MKAEKGQLVVHIDDDTTLAGTRRVATNTARYEIAHRWRHMPADAAVSEMAGVLAALVEDATARGVVHPVLLATLCGYAREDISAAGYGRE